MPKKMRIALAQINSFVGGIRQNGEKIIQQAHIAHEQYAADLIVFPELAICGYPPEDLLFREHFLHDIELELQHICHQISGIACIIGAPRRAESKLYNSALLLAQGTIETVADKQILPNYGVFDEKRYFTPGLPKQPVQLAGYHLAVTICEDIWQAEPVGKACSQGAEVVINLNASPYHIGKVVERRQVVQQRCLENQVPIFYVHTVGGQDEVVFDGTSFACDRNGKLIGQAASFAEDLLVIDYRETESSIIGACQAMLSEADEVAGIYQALVLAVRDYVHKNGFKGAVIGLSGGVDSALTLAIAVAALGADNVEAVMMPSRYTSQMSLQDAQHLAANLAVQYEVITIEPAFQAINEALKDVFAGLSVDSTEENIQARCRGILLMAISNKKRRLVLATGNKSEMAVGYATLYGDMAGGFAPLKDVSKGLVYKLCEYINRDGEKIPERILTRAPSAELAENQTDQDSLPPYEQLDRILELYIEQTNSVEAIAAQGFDVQTVKEIVRKVNINEYKRRQAAPGVKITKCAFGRERRYPMTSAYDKSC